MLYLVVGYGEHALQGEHHLEGADGEVAEQAPTILSQRSECIILDDFKYTRGMLCLVYTSTWGVLYLGYTLPGVYSTWGIPGILSSCIILEHFSQIRVPWVPPSYLTPLGKNPLIRDFFLDCSNVTVVKMTNFVLCVLFSYLFTHYTPGSPSTICIWKICTRPHEYPDIAGVNGLKIVQNYVLRRQKSSDLFFLVTLYLLLAY